MAGHRRSIRLKDYDYTSAGAYYVTLCIYRRECILGSIADEAMSLSNIGDIVQAQWERIPEQFEHAELDEFIVMPNHLHGIIVLLDAATPVGANNPPHDPSSERGMHVAGYSPFAMQPAGTASGSLGAIIQNFKKNTGRIVNRIRRTPGQPLWQRGYYEHIVRSEEELERIREYIRTNPARWADDPENR